LAAEIALKHGLNVLVIKVTNFMYPEAEASVCFTDVRGRPIKGSEN
jgi:hypothetical protein